MPPPVSSVNKHKAVEGTSTRLGRELDSIKGWQNKRRLPWAPSLPVAVEKLILIQPWRLLHLSTDGKTSRVAWSSISPHLRFHHIHQDNHGCWSRSYAKWGWAKYFNEPCNKPNRGKQFWIQNCFVSLKPFVLLRRTHRRISDSEMTNEQAWPYLSVISSEWWQFYMDKWLGTDRTNPDMEKFTQWLPNFTLIKSAHWHSSVMSSH